MNVLWLAVNTLYVSFQNGEYSKSSLSQQCGLLWRAKEKASVLMLCVEMPTGRPHSLEIFKQDEYEHVYSYNPSAHHICCQRKPACTQHSTLQMQQNKPTIKVPGRQWWQLGFKRWRSMYLGQWKYGNWLWIRCTKMCYDSKKHIRP